MQPDLQEVSVVSCDVLGVFADVLVKEGAVLDMGVAVGHQHLGDPEGLHKHCCGNGPDEPLLDQRPVHLLDPVLQEEEGGGGDGQPGLHLSLGVVSALDGCLDKSCGACVPAKAVHLVVTAGPSEQTIRLCQNFCGMAMVLVLKKISNNEL